MLIFFRVFSSNWLKHYIKLLDRLSVLAFHLFFWVSTSAYSFKCMSFKWPVLMPLFFLPVIIFVTAVTLWLQFSSVSQLCPTLCDPMNCSIPGLPTHHQLLEFTQIHVHWVGDAIQPSYPLLSPSPPVFNLSQHQGLFKWVIMAYFSISSYILYCSFYLLQFYL